jgi:hypothetical protein
MHRLEDCKFEQVPCILKVHQAYLDVPSRLALAFSSSLVLPLRLAGFQAYFANHLDDCQSSTRATHFSYEGLK